MSSSVQNSLNVSDDLLKEAEIHAETRLSDLKEKNTRRKKSLVKLGTMLFLTALVIIFATIAWFTMNREVGTSGMGVSVATEKYQIMPVTGSASIYEDFRLDEIKSGDALVWNMTSTAKMDNYDSNVDKGISPGSYGALSFLVQPKDNSIALNLTFQITGYSYESTVDPDTKEITSETMTQLGSSYQSYLAGHILLFEERTPIYYKDSEGKDTDRVKTYTYSKPIMSTVSNDKILLNRTFYKTDPETGTTPVTTIYWVWPKTLSSIINASGNDNVNIEPFCVDDPEDSEDAYDLVSGNVSAYPSRYFYGYSGSTPLGIAVMVDDYDIYGELYDSADNEIGTNVSYITLKLISNEAATE